MSWSAHIDLEWGGEERRFALRIRELQALEDAVGGGPLEIWQRLRRGTWRVADIRSVIRYGLEGGGVPPNDAGKLVERYVDQRPLMESVPVAMLVLGTALWIPDDVQGKQEAEGEAAGGSLSA